MFIFISGPSYISRNSKSIHLLFRDRVGMASHREGEHMALQALLLLVKVHWKEILRLTFKLLKANLRCLGYIYAHA